METCCGFGYAWRWELGSPRRGSLTHPTFHGPHPPPRGRKESAPLPARDLASLPEGFPQAPHQAVKPKRGLVRGGGERWSGMDASPLQLRSRRGVLTPFPFGDLPHQRESLDTHVPPLGAPYSWPIAVHTKPFSTSVHKVPTCVDATPTKICTRAGSSRFRKQPSTPAPRLPTCRSFFWVKGATPRYGPSA